MATTRRRLEGRYSRIAVSIVAAGGVGVVFSILLAIFWRQDAWALLAGSATGAAIGVWVLGLPPAESILRPSGLPAAFRVDILRLGVAGAVTSPMYWLMNSADRWFLGLLQGAEPLGVYSFAAGVGTIGMMVNNGIMLAWFPEVTRLHEESGEEARAQIGRLWARFSAGLLVAWLGVTAAGGDIIRLLADPRFHEGAGYVPWLAGGILFYGIATMANTGLILAKDMAPAISWWIAGAMVNAGFNALLVKPLGGMGCSVAAAVGYAVVAAGVMCSAQTRFHLPVPWGALATAAVLAAVAGVLLSLPWADSALVSLCLKFPVGAAIGVAVLYIVAPDWVLRLFLPERRG
jgi:O-antigen/teichoic acid export membrane protein